MYPPGRARAARTPLPSAPGPGGDGSCLRTDTEETDTFLCLLGYCRHLFLPPLSHAPGIPCYPSCCLPSSTGMSSHDFYLVSTPPYSLSLLTMYTDAEAGRKAYCGYLASRLLPFLLPFLGPFPPPFLPPPSLPPGYPFPPTIRRHGASGADRGALPGEKTRQKRERKTSGPLRSQGWLRSVARTRREEGAKRKEGEGRKKGKWVVRRSFSILWPFHVLQYRIMSPFLPFFLPPILVPRAPPTHLRLEGLVEAGGL